MTLSNFGPALTPVTLELLLLLVFCLTFYGNIDSEHPGFNISEFLSFSETADWMIQNKTEYKKIKHRKQIKIDSSSPYMNPSITAGHFDGLLFTGRAEQPTETPSSNMVCLITCLPTCLPDFKRTFWSSCLTLVASPSLTSELYKRGCGSVLGKCQSDQ